MDVLKIGRCRRRRGCIGSRWRRAYDSGPRRAAGVRRVWHDGPDGHTVTVLCDVEAVDAEHAKRRLLSALAATPVELDDFEAIAGAEDGLRVMVHESCDARESSLPMAILLASKASLCDSCDMSDAIIYGCRNRPPGFATVPKGWESATHPDFRWAVSYARPLSDEDARRFELERILTEREIAFLIGKLSVEMPYPTEWVTLADEGPEELNALRGALADQIRRMNDTWYIPQADRASLVDVVVGLLQARVSLGVL